MRFYSFEPHRSQLRICLPRSADDRRQWVVTETGEGNLVTVRTVGTVQRAISPVRHPQTAIAVDAVADRTVPPTVGCFPTLSADEYRAIQKPLAPIKPVWLTATVTDVIQSRWQFLAARRALPTHVHPPFVRPLA